ncbi:hypothetical protein ACVC7V_00575 [Hydrogenophaga sp. A37]|uniref:hypothetical protein n=1 Tax=Hydrogenophaga sp. A37 TaxID=1945864 RepID=UPI00117BB11A|nr:hypothetical protein [Hydrogenophaga sp. A37]
MPAITTIVAAGNTMAPSLAEVRALGYEVSRGTDCGGAYVAEGLNCRLVADDPLALLGLVKLFELRGRNWQPTDDEVSAFLVLEDEA